MSNEIRKGCKDVWNAFMCEEAFFTQCDIPYCPTTATKTPSAIITWDEAKAIYKKHRIKGENDFYNDSFVCWYIDDYKFDGPRGIWHDYKFALKVLSHFAGIITPDFSTYQDFPEPLKMYNTYRMRAFGYWLGRNGINVINNVRWGTSETYRYCFDGIPTNSIVAIGTCGGSPRKMIDRKRFEDGLFEMVARLKPHTIIVYGSARYDCFEKLKEQGIKIIDFPSQTAKAFERRKSMSKGNSGHFSGTGGTTKAGASDSANKSTTYTATASLKDHIINPDSSSSNKSGIKGGHHKDNFMREVKKVGAKTTNTVPNSQMEGVEKISYKMPKKDKFGNPTKDLQAKTHHKTVYDSSKISSKDYIKRGLEAANNAAKKSPTGKLRREWMGIDNRGVRWRGYCDSDGNITSFYPED